MLARRTAGLICAVLSALLLFAAGEPVGLGPLAWVALVPLFAAVLAAGTVRRAWLCGFAFGLVYFGIEISWIFLFGWMAWSGLTVFLAVYVSLGVLVAGVVRRSAFAPVLVAGAWVVAELLRDRVPWGGYSWGSLGTTQGSVPGVRWLAGTIGVYGLSFLVAFFAACIAWVIVRREMPWTSVAVVAVVLVAFAGVDAVRYGNPERGEPFRVAVVQGGVPRPVVVGQRDAILRNHIDATRALLADKQVDVVVWPEESVGDGAAPGALQTVEALAREVHTPFLVGNTFIEGDAFFNVVRHIDAEGGLVETYQKRHPVPFGEYVPVGFFRRFVGTLQDQIPTDQAPGTEANVFDVARDEGDARQTKIATPICFESVFPRDFLDFVDQGAELFVLSTNDSSFERTYASQQHVAHSRMRALETRQWVVEAALSGISAVIAPDGGLSDQTKLFTTAAFAADVRTRPAQSLYAETGDLFPALFALASVVAFLVALVRRRKPEPTDPPPDHAGTEILAA